MITVRPYEPAQRGRWNQFIQTARNSHFLFDRGFMEYHADRFRDASLMFETRGGLGAVLPAHRRFDEAIGGELLCSHEGLSFAGLITGPSMRQGTIERVFEALVDHLRRNDLRALDYRAMPSVYRPCRGEEDLWCLHRHGAVRIETKVTAVVRLGSPASTSKNFRRQARRAADAGVVVGWWEDVEGFHALLSDWLRERHRAVPVHSARELRLLCDRFPSHIRLLAARRRGAVVAAEMIFITPACVRLQYGANTDEGMSMGALQAILMRLIETLHPGGWLDLGTSMDPATGDLTTTLHQFKESCGARTMLQSTYRVSV